MSISRSLARLTGIVAAILILAPRISEAACVSYQTVPDGRIRGPYTISNATSDVAVQFQGVLGKSYSAEAMVVSAPFDAASGSVSANWGGAGTLCPTSNVSGLRRTDIIDPAPQASAASLVNYFRGSFTAGATNFYVFRIGNASATAVTVEVTITETTQFSPGWSTFGTYDTFYSILNTTRSTCSGVLTLYDTAGVAVTVANLTVPPGATTGTNTSAMGTVRNTTGTAKLTHDCPPGAFLSEAAIANFSISPPYFQFVHFEGTREAKTH